MNLKLLSSKLSDNKLFGRIILICSLIGITDTLYLTSDYLLGTGVKCVITKGCDVVLSSAYATLFGLPLALYGLLFYIFIFVVVTLVDIYGNALFFRILKAGASVGFLVSMLLLYVQIFVLKSLCIYCLTSAISSTIIFISAILYREAQSAKDGQDVILDR